MIGYGIYYSLTFHRLYILWYIQVSLNLTYEPNGTSFNITWHEPEGKLKDKSLRYDIICICYGKHCNRTCSAEKYNPGQYNITQTFVEVSNLKPGGRYVFKVCPKVSLKKKYTKEKWNFNKTACDVIMAPGKSSMKCDIFKNPDLPAVVGFYWTCITIA